ncbi:MAG: helix-turn-helix domain-containing protein [Chloroflexota bacterium]
MPSRYRRQDTGAHHADALLQKLGAELRAARLAAGLSLREVEAASGISRAQLARMEGAHAPGVTLRALSTVFAVLGQRLSARPYPEGPPVRDAAHARLLDRFRRRLSQKLRFRTEVPLRLDRDQRAWDGQIIAQEGDCRVEAETVLQDIQTTDRRIALKMVDDDVDRVVLLVAATQHNRRVLREFRSLIADRYPLETRAVLKALREGRIPVRSGVVIL